MLDIQGLNCISQPFLLRGGNWWNGSNAGVFASNGNNGNANNNNGFRPVLVVEQHFDTQRNIKVSIPDGQQFKDYAENVNIMM